MTADVPQLTAGAPPSLAAEFERHRERLRLIVEGRLDPALRARADADDVLAAALVKAHGRWPAYLETRTPAIFLWLYQITIDCFIDCWRRERAHLRDCRRDEPWPEQTAVQIGLGLVALGTSPSSAAARSELYELVRQTMDLLRPDDRDVLLRRYQDDLSFEELGQLFGVSENAATQRCLRALRRLQKLWRRRHGDLGFEG